MARTPIKDLRKLYKQYKEDLHYGKKTKYVIVRPVTCYVCGRKLPKAISVYIGQDIYRHSECEAGSASWLRHRKKSLMYEFFINRKEKKC